MYFKNQLLKNSWHSRHKHWIILGLRYTLGHYSCDHRCIVVFELFLGGHLELWKNLKSPPCCVLLHFYDQIEVHAVPVMIFWHRLSFLIRQCNFTTLFHDNFSDSHKFKKQLIFNANSFASKENLKDIKKKLLPALVAIVM